jgi:hypothetical protein
MFDEAGHPTTLADYREIALVLSGDENSEAVKFFDDKIAQQGPDERVIAAESQMMMLIMSML